MISGAMPRWQKNVHRLGLVVTCLLLGGLGLANFYSLSIAHGLTAVNGMLFLTFWLIVVAAVGIGSQLWYWWGMVSDFTYDGGALRFRTLGRASAETRALPETADIREWAGADLISAIVSASTMERKSICRTLWRIPPLSRSN